MPDLSRLRHDLLAFSRAIGMPLEPWQVEPFMSTARTRVIVAPRQAGKSRALAVYALWCAFRRGNVRVLVISAGEDAARRLLAEIRRVAAASPLLRASVDDELAGLLTLTNGSEVRSVPASERQIRGWTVDHLVVDEAALVADELLLGAALPTTAARHDSDITLASSANVASGVFYDFARRGETGGEHAETFRWRLEDCTWITPSMVETMRESMSEVRFRAEMEGIFASGADALFTRALLDRITADMPVATLATLTGPARVSGGCDYGATSDRSTCCAWARSPVANEDPVLMVVLAERWSAGEPLNNVIKSIAASPAHWAVLTSERNGLGEPCTQALFRRIRQRRGDEGGARPRKRVMVMEDSAPPRKKSKRPAKPRPRAWATKLNAVHTSAPMKSAAYSALRILADREQVVIPASASDLIRELLMLRVDLTASGGERVEAGSGHDDLADALMLAMAPHKTEDGHWTTALERWADPRRQSSHAAPQQLEIETAETPGGRLVPRSLTYQSVSGRSLTLDPSAVRSKKTRVGANYVIKP